MDNLQRPLKHFYNVWSLRKLLKPLALSCLFHTAEASAMWTELAATQDCRRQKISTVNMFSFVQSTNAVWIEFCPVLTQFPICN